MWTVAPNVWGCVFTAFGVLPGGENGSPGPSGSRGSIGCLMPLRWRCGSPLGVDPGARSPRGRCRFGSTITNAAGMVVGRRSPYGGT